MDDSMVLTSLWVARGHVFVIHYFVLYAMNVPLIFLIFFNLLRQTVESIGYSCTGYVAIKFSDSTSGFSRQFTGQENGRLSCHILF